MTATALAALVLTWLLWPVMRQNPFLFFFGVAALSAWYGGLRPGLLAAGLGAALVYLLLSASRGRWAPSGADLGGLSLFILLSVALAWFSEHRQRAERARRRSDESFAKLFASASEGIVIADEHGRITSINERAERMFGYRRGELIGQNVDQLVPVLLREGHAAERSAYAARPQSRAMGTGRELRGRRRDGTEFPVEISLSYVRDERSPAVMAFVVDITERKEAEATIRRHQERLQRMALELAVAGQREARRIAVELHDRVGQDLALAQITLARFRQELGRPAAGPGLDEGIALVAQAIENTRSLTFDLCPPVLYDLGLEAALSWLADEMQERHGFDVHLQAELPGNAIRGERAALLFRIIRELVMNAVKHAHTDRAQVQVRREGEALQVVVADAGEGFDHPPGVLGPDTGRGGFGLFSIHEQVEQLGGRMWIDAAVGRGTRVQLELPHQEGCGPGGREPVDGNSSRAGR